MKKVLIFSLAYYPRFVGGAEVAIKEITDRIPDIEFHLITYRFDSLMPETEKIGNIFVHRIGKGKRNTGIGHIYGAHFFLGKVFFIPRAAYRGVILHKKHHFDGLWAMMVYMLFPVVLMRMCGVKIPYLLTLQEGDPFEHVFSAPQILPFRPLLSIGFRSANIIQAISTYLGGWAQRMKFKGDLEIVPNGVAVGHFSQSKPDANLNKIRDSLRKEREDVLLITASRLVHKNALDDVIRALVLMPGNVRFAVVGDGPKREELIRLARGKGVEDRVLFVGQLDHTELPTYLQACDIFIRPSRSEGMGNAFVEAMAAGLPVIATQEGGIADFLFDEKRNPDKPMTGWAVDTDSPEQIAAAVKDIMAHPEKMRAVVATARAMVKEKYDWDVIARDMRTKVFERLFREQHI